MAAMSTTRRQLKETADAAHVWLILWKACRAVEKNALASILRLKLCLSDFAVLELLLHKGPQPVNAIGKKILLTSGSITTAIDRLEKKKLVHRTVAPIDRRARIVHLTESGKRLIEQAFQQHAADVAETIGILRTAEQKELVRLLKKVGLWAEARAES